MQLREIAEQDLFEARAYDLFFEVRRLREALMECATISGNEPLDERHLSFPDIVEYTTDAVRELRRDYDALLMGDDS